MLIIMQFSLNSTIIQIPHTSNIARIFIIFLSPTPPAHRECIRELGEPVMKKAYQLLDKVDPEQAEVYHRGDPSSNCTCDLSLFHAHTHCTQEVLFGLLGKDAAFSLTGKLQQLKLCEDSLYEL